MANHDDTGQQDTLESSKEGALSGGQAPEQEGRLTGRGESEQGHQGMVPAQEAEQDQMSLQELGVPQGEEGTPPAGVLEPGTPMSDHQGNKIAGSAPEELPERGVVPAPAARLEGEGEQPLNA